jgi:hypothetical protein
MKTANVSRYAVMPELTLTGVSANVRAICGSAVAMTVLSSCCMKNANDTMSAIKAGRRGADTMVGLKRP